MKLSGLFCTLMLVALAACGNAEQQSAAPNANSESTVAGAPAKPEQDLLAFGSGAYFVQMPDGASLADVNSGPINMIDESDPTSWMAEAGQPAVFVVELAERSKLSRLVFDNAGLTHDENGVKGLTVEISDSSATDGFSKILSADLKMTTNGQSFPLTPAATGRWLRITVLSNHGGEYQNIAGIKAYGEQLTHEASVANVSGTYEGGNGWGAVHLKQEGSRVIGCYEYRSGMIAGGIEGRVLKAELFEQVDGGSPERQLGLFAFPGPKGSIFGLARLPDSVLWGVYAGEKISDDIGECPNIPDWKGQAAKSQLGSALEKSGRARLDGVNFDFNSATIRAESKPLLDQVAALLKEHGDWKITLEGHTDNVGGADFNKTLSTNRAAAVKAYLVSAGVDAAKLSSAGFGFDKPVAPNDSEAGRAQNRRVEIVKG